MRFDRTGYDSPVPIRIFDGGRRVVEIPPRLRAEDFEIAGMKEFHPGRRATITAREKEPIRRS